MRFTKMEGCGNDYIYIDGSKEIIPPDEKPALVRKLSDRHFGIGSDGVIFINPSDIADFEMEMYNSDGSRSEMCGNGMRCVAKFVYDKHLTDKLRIKVVSMGRELFPEMTLGDDGLVSEVRVDMGSPILTPADVPVSIPGAGSASVIKDCPIDIEDYRITCVSMGNPHAVVFLPEDTDLSTFDIQKTGPLFEHHRFFPNRVNTEFVHVDNRNEVHMRVWERGAGETLACGTGCCATAVASILGGYTDRKVTVHVLGGDIVCEWPEAGEGGEPAHVFMTGPAVTVFEGEV